MATRNHPHAFISCQLAFLLGFSFCFSLLVGLKSSFNSTGFCACPCVKSFFVISFATAVWF